MNGEENYILKMEHVSKLFPGVKALDDVNFVIKRGEIHALVGENGAGKSTLIKIITGIYHPDEGRIFFDGKEVTIKGVEEARDLGIAVIHQELAMAPNMTVAENIYMGRFPTKMGGLFVDRKKMERDAEELLKMIGLFDIQPDVLVKKLSVAQQQMVEICKALSQDITLLVMDEPTASLAQHETDVLLDIMRRLKDKGVSIMFVSHKLNEVYSVCDRITVLRDGKYIATRDTDELPNDELIKMMVGREIQNIYPPHETNVGEVFFEANHIYAARVNDISFNLRKGEILGFYGLVGAGRSELIRALFGIDPNRKGEICLDGQPIKINNPVDAVKAGIVFAPEDRKGQGLFLRQTVDFNMSITVLDRLIKGIRRNKALNEQMVMDMGQKLRVKTPSYDTTVQSLSGGNQQKIVLGKWLMADPRILILDEPTRGIDVGAKQEIYNLVYQIVKSGVSVVYISSEMAEILNLCDRVYIMHQGSIIPMLNRNELNEEAIIRHALGGC